MAKVLIIDDDPGVRTVIRQALEDEQIDVVEAEDGREGLKQFSAHKPTVVVTDIIMPNMEGVETIMTLRKLSPGVRLVAISGGGRVGAKDFLDAAKKLGADRVLPKPFDDDVLVGMIKELIADSAAPATA